MRSSRTVVTKIYPPGGDILTLSHSTWKSAPLYKNHKWELGWRRPAGKPGRSKAESGTGFGTHLGGAEAATPSSVASAPTGVGALLAAQSVGDALDGRARAYDHAEALLKRLDGLRLALLDGAISDVALQKLADDVDGEKYNTNIILLDELVVESELGAAVELAKRNLI
jgi:hypothetical protein